MWSGSSWQSRAARWSNPNPARLDMAVNSVEKTSGHGRVEAVHDWLGRRADTRVGRLALQWFRAYFAASRSSGCAVTVYSTLSVLPAVLVVAAVLHPSSGDANVFAQRLITT